MRSLPTARRSPALLGLLALALPLLAGCGLGVSRAKFVSRTNTACKHSAARIAAMRQPESPNQAIGYAIDLFAQKDRLLMELNEADLPSAEAAPLRSGWLRPATDDLGRARAHLPALRRAVRAGDADRVTAELDALRAADTAGVDDDLLTRLGLTDCLTVFGDPRHGDPAG